MTTEITVPKTLQEAIIYFSDPDIALEFMVDLCFPNGPVCRNCGCLEPTFIKTRRIWQCKGCKKQFSVKTGTIFEDSPIECDETYIGGKAKNMHAGTRQEMRERGFPKTAVMGFRERDGEVRTMVISDNTKETLQAKVLENVKSNANLFTDSAKGYAGLSKQYNHKNGQYVIEHEDGTLAHTQGIEGYWNLLDRCYQGTYVIMSPQRQERYLAEQDFRYNTRKERMGRGS